MDTNRRKGPSVPGCNCENKPKKKIHSIITNLPLILPLEPQFLVSYLPLRTCALP